ncbi:MAG: Acyl-coenzyme A:6-aminopenicillanic acid acyl-transferase [Bacteroidetes bacterium ADurb.Bin041]|nr:MAG: Acyl-coenzyme A:6-aminopenicillanic acid acyl-transferase [Bacteroidetes bacterium ADurb.Bin041]
MRHIKHFLIVIFFIFSKSVYCCTTAVISGKATNDGRALIWKLRDTDYLKNYVKQFPAEDGKYAFIGIVNSVDSVGNEVWGGNNEVGFAIMNSASFNVNLDDSVKVKDKEGFFMKKALETCKTLEDFENLLSNSQKPMGLAAHFGVIDAKGGAAFYEVNNYTWTKYDANDPNVAPEGYILRTNFSETGKPNVGYGFVRLQTAEQLFTETTNEKTLDYRSVIQNFSRCLYNPITKNNYKEMYENEPASNRFIHSDNLITSYGSASCIVIQGVKDNELPQFTTMWTMIGYPNTCIALPLWISESELPNTIIYNDSLKNSKLNQYNMSLLKKCYPIDNPDGYHYLKISKLVNKENNGYMQIITHIETNIFDETDKKLNKWRNKMPPKSEIEQFYTQLNNIVEKTYKQILDK